MLLPGRLGALQRVDLLPLKPPPPQQLEEAFELHIWRDLHRRPLLPPLLKPFKLHMLQHMTQLQHLATPLTQSGEVWYAAWSCWQHSGRDCCLPGPQGRRGHQPLLAPAAMWRLLSIASHQAVVAGNGSRCWSVPSSTKSNWLLLALVINRSSS